MNKSSNLILVSNRLPVNVRLARKKWSIVPSTGGLATGLRSPHEQGNVQWFGWPGDLHRLDDCQRKEVDVELTKLRLVPIHLSGAEIQHFYHGFSNGVLWPLFHYLLDRIPLDSRDWEEYQQVNDKFATIVAQHYQEGDTIWIHDYQLTLVPAMLRQRLPHARIGFFLHIPFPSSEVFRLLPWRAEILKGLLGADLLGFHTYSYLRHFATSLLRILGLEVVIDRVWHKQREIRLGVYPMGIDAASFDAQSQEPAIVEESKSIRGEEGVNQLILGVDRLDYTKGIPRRLLAFERLLENEPALRGKVRLVLVAVPSRSEVQAYETFKRQVDELIGRINGKFSTAQYVPIHYIHRALAQRQLTALYCAADVMAVTPLRDGLNLVAKEFIACRSDLDGVLVLSEFTGAAAELTEALMVNPYDIDGVARALAQALRMDSTERSARMEPMRERVRTNDIHNWVKTFLGDLKGSTENATRSVTHKFTPSAIETALQQVQSAEQLILFLDYDGTLLPLVKHPDLAIPSTELLSLLDRLAKRPATNVHIVSGRDKTTLEKWLGRLPLSLHAEHGLWSWNHSTRNWHRNIDVSDEWKQKVRPILEEFVKHLPGSFVEEKSAGIAWHYRQAEPDSGSLHAKELRLHLIEVLSNVPVEVITGDKVVEIRVQGINKGSIISRVLAEAQGAPLALAMGDDRTDEDLFSTLPPNGISIHVGPGPSRATYRLGDQSAVKGFLQAIL